MIDEASHAYQAKLQTLRSRYLQRLKKSLRDVRRLEELLHRGLAPLKDLQAIAHLAHNLIGSGATFGFPAISDSAISLEKSLKMLIAASSASHDPHAERRDLQDRIAVFYNASRTAIQADAPVAKAVTPPASKRDDADQTAHGTRRVVGVLARKEAVVADILRDMAEDGYKTVFVDHVQALRHIPDLSAVILSNDVSVADQAVLNGMLSRREPLALSAPVIAWLGQDDFKARLEMSRLGITQCLAAEAGWSDLKPVLQRLTTRARRQPRVYISSMDDMMLHFYEHVLAQAGMAVTLLKPHKDPVRVLRDDPEGLLIVDFALPFGSGHDVISVIQSLPTATEQARGRPIIFTATAEEYTSLPTPPVGVTVLLKPFTPEQLLHAARACLEV